MKYTAGKYKYFDLLVTINNHYFPNDNFGDNVRENDEKYLALYNNLLEDFFHKLRNFNSLDEFIELSLNITGYLWLQQPFFDGNTRTLKSFLKLTFKNLNYDLNVNIIDDDRHIIPLFYYDDEKCTEIEINNFKRRLTKID